jgi:hypothetical protein
MRHVPHGPKPQALAVHFEGPGVAVMCRVGLARYPGNPAICGNCMNSTWSQTPSVCGEDVAAFIRPPSGDRILSMHREEKVRCAP